MKSWKDWHTADAEFAKDYSTRIDDSTPEPLFESFHIPTPKVCLRCGQRRATSLLFSTLDMRPVLPLCSNCAADWNIDGYRILKGVSAKTLLWRLLSFKLKHPFSAPSALDIKRDLQGFQRWASKMKKLKDGESG
jgi:hypothetical protein